MGSSIIILLFVFTFIIFVLYTLIDAVRSEFKDNINKIIWILLIVFLAPLGSILYLFIAKKQKK